jgi:hypothetical protein
MKPDFENWSLVIMGYWDSRIILPHWISANNLSTSKNISVEIPFLDPVSPARYGYDDIYLKVSDNRLMFSPKKNDDKVLEQIKDNAVIILKELNHTPVRAIGINFQFIEENPNENLLSLFKLNGDEIIADCGMTCQITKIKRTLLFELDGIPQIMNLTNTLMENNKILLEANYHKDIKNTDEALTFINRGLLIFRDSIFDLLPKLYPGEIIE